MISQDHAELVHRVLDGEATDEERALLGALRAESSEVRTLYDDLEATDAFVSRLTLTAPPPDMKARVMASLPPDLYARGVRNRPLAALQVVRDELAKLLRARPALALAYAMVLGIVVGAAAVATWTNGDRMPSASEAYGTFVSPDLLAQLDVTDQQAIAAASVEGIARLRVAGDQAVLEVELAGPAEIEIGVSFDPADLRWDGLIRVDGPAARTMSMDEGSVRLSASGSIHYLLRFEARAPAFQLDLDLAGERGEAIRFALHGPAREHLSPARRDHEAR